MNENRHSMKIENSYPYQRRLYLLSSDKNIYVLDYPAIFQENIVYEDCTLQIIKNSISNDEISSEGTKIPTGLDETPFDFLIYNNNFYFLLREGVFAQRISGKKQPRGPANKICDLRPVSFTVGTRNHLWLSCLNEGAYDLNLNDLSQIEVISKDHTSFIDKADSFYLLGSYVEESHLFLPEHHRLEPSHYFFKYSEKERYPLLTFKDKLYFIHEDGIYCSSFHTCMGMFGEPKLKFQAKLSLCDYICGKITNFGVVLEFNDYLYVFPYQGKSFIISTEERDYLSFQVFSSTSSYSNELHVIFQNHIDIYRFETTLSKKKVRIINSGKNALVNASELSDFPQRINAHTESERRYGS